MIVDILELRILLDRKAKAYKLETINYVKKLLE